ncbi:MAG: DUF2513 domain-containing protein [Acidobacteria bacterium]|nr:DUF2513 domain-containing protein [Acidobacteriota bacterium]
MKRDLQLIKEILLYVEEHAEEGAAPIGRIDLEGEYSQPQIAGHVQLLLIDAGFVDGKICRTHTSGSSYLVSRLTWSGSEFLDDARDERVWKRVLREVGYSASVSLVKVMLEKVRVELLGGVE